MTLERHISFDVIHTITPSQVYQHGSLQSAGVAARDTKWRQCHIFSPQCCHSHELTQNALVVSVITIAAEFTRSPPMFQSAELGIQIKSENPLTANDVVRFGRKEDPKRRRNFS